MNHTSLVIAELVKLAGVNSEQFVKREKEIVSLDKLSENLATNVF